LIGSAALWCGTDAERPLLDHLNKQLLRLPVSCTQDAPRLPTVAIVGVPCSGTTLLHQVLAATGGFGYCTNLIGRFHCRPGLGAQVQRLLSPFLPVRRPGFDWRYPGQVQWNAPTELAEFWERHFPFHDHHEPAPAALAAVNRAGLARELAELEQELGLPLLLKSLSLCFVLPFLAELLPKLRFIRLVRPLEEVARSNLQLRFQHYGIPRPWLAVRPRGAERMIASPPEAQIAYQLAAVGKALARAQASIGPDRWVDIHYDDLCAAPARVAAYVSEFAGVRLAAGALRALPASFARSRGGYVPAASATRLRSALAAHSACRCL
jgi:hypothetical protein